LFSRKKKYYNIFIYFYILNYKINMRVPNLLSGFNDEQFFTVPGTFQAALSPRFNPIGYGALVSYNLPNYGMLGVPPSPISYAGMTNTPRGIANLPLSPQNWYQYGNASSLSGPVYNMPNGVRQPAQQNMRPASEICNSRRW
jgi:hypothetical protein